MLGFEVTQSKAWTQMSAYHVRSDVEPVNVIYGLHLGDRRYRYVGLTTKGAKARLSSHRANATRGVSFPVYQWMRKYGNENIQVDILEVADTPEDLDALERKWIRELKEAGHLLLNCNDGGGSSRGFTFTRDAEYRDRMSERLRGRKLSDEHRQNISKGNTGKILSAETRTNIGLAKKGNKYNLGRKHSKETREKMRIRDRSGPLNGFYGKSQPESAKAKLSADRKGRPNPSTHARWHKNRNISKPNTCVFCKEEMRDNDESN
jgi:group I intron endonuclease